MTAWFYTGIVGAFGLTLTGVAAVGAGIAAVWVAVGLLLGRRYNKGGDL